MNSPAVEPVGERALQAATWRWTDITRNEAMTVPDLPVLGGLDQLAVRDAFTDHDLPKLDDFGDHLLLVIHGLRDDDIATYEVDVFVSDCELVTIHRDGSPGVDAVWAEIERSSALAPETTGELAAVLADVLTRRLLAVVDAFDLRADELVVRALEADPDVLGEITAIRSDIARTRRVIQPQRETLDRLRKHRSVILSEAATRRFADVFDVAIRTIQGLDSARTALSETLDAYRGAEARRATDVNRVLTIYAAIMLPLSLVAGFFGMNHPNLPGINSDRGWLMVAAAMILITTASLAVFVSLGWIRRPAKRSPRATVERGLIEAARAPIEAGLALTADPQPPQPKLDTPKRE